MDFRLGEEAERVRVEIRRFLEAEFDDAARAREHETGDGHDPESYAKLAAAGWVSAGWPVEYGGQGHGPYEFLAMTWELSRAGFPWYGLLNNGFMGHTLLELGTEAQRRELVPGIASGELTIALGYSEPGAGSDVAAAQTQARQDGEQWVINGQKMFTTMAHLSQYVFTLTRTSPEKKKHKGLTLFLVPTDAPGVEIHPVETMGGERTNIVYFNDVRVEDGLRVGEVDGGWAVLRFALGLEQAIGYADRMEKMVDRATHWAREEAPAGRGVDDPRVRERLAQMAIHAEVATLLRHRSTWAQAEGLKLPAAGPMTKAFSGQMFLEDANEWMNLVGPDGLLKRGESGALLDGEFEEAFRQAPVTTIYGGTLEVLRNIIAEAGLGLPRSR